MSRRTIFELVDKFSSRIETQLCTELVYHLRALSDLPKYGPKTTSVKRELMDIFTLWYSIKSYKNYAKSEPTLSVDLLSIPIFKFQRLLRHR